jgi:hypothetical protein
MEWPMCGSPGLFRGRSDDFVAFLYEPFVDGRLFLFQG